VGCGSFFGGGSCFCVLAIICVHFGGFVIVSGQSSWFLSSRLRWWSIGVDVVAGWSLVVIGGHHWCGGSGGGGRQKETTSHGVWLVVSLVTGVKQTNKH